jgi:tRNA modification GTPase
LIGDRAEDWRRRLIGALALVEARIDFSDEADVPEDLITPALDEARQLRNEIAAVLADGGRGERLRDGLVVAIAGPPNAGKSTLLNWLARRDAAIVSPYPGTTRDVIEVHFDLGGYPMTLLDTAGIRESDDPLEQEGVRRARARAATADLVLWVTDLSATGASAVGRETEGASRDFGGGALWQVRNKIDLITERMCSRNESQFNKCDNHSFTISAGTGTGLDALISALTEYAEAYFASSESTIVTRQRHRQALALTVEALDRALTRRSVREELIAEELRLAAVTLGRLTGRVDVEDVLDVIFREFCIGK